MQLDISQSVSRGEIQNSSNDFIRTTWECPPHVFCKINSDVSIDKKLCVIGIGVAVRDEGNFWLL